MSKLLLVCLTSILSLQVVAAPSADFDGSGKKVDDAENKVPIFTFVSPVIRSVAENTSDRQNIGDPVSATDPDGDSLTYRLSGPDANSFTIVSSSGQIQTKAGVTYSYEKKGVYSVIVEAEDGRGGTDAMAVRIAVLSSDISPIYQKFVEAKEKGTEPILPDFSYSGYHYFNKPVPDVAHPIFDVTTYGAIPNDDLSDQKAIQAAIDAAEANGRGVVFFPLGEFLVNTDVDNNKLIYIRSSNIVLRGSGSRKEGTVIRQQLPVVPVRSMFRFKPSDVRYKRLTRITESAERETFWLTVADASRLKVGQWIRIYMRSTKAIDEFLAPRSSERRWKKLFDEGITIDEEHSIAEIQGNRIRLNEPLHTRVNHAYNWVVRSYEYLEEVGVEDISFHGSFREAFVHHKSNIHNGGWRLLTFNHCVNSYIRRTSFISVNNAINLTRSAAISVYQVTVAGNKGHFGFHSQDSYGMWVGLSEDIAGQVPYSTVPLIDGPKNTRAVPGQHHGVGMSHNSTGIVICRFDMAPNQPLDIHKTDPSYANLYDCVNNGRLSGSSGGGVPPHHLRRLVFWNFNHGGDDTRYDFWQGYLRFLHPIVVGFYGNPVTFNENTLEVLESNGSPVEPESLFESQLALRLGKLPIWLNALRTEWETLRKIPLPK